MRANSTAPFANSFRRRAPTFDTTTSSAEQRTARPTAPREPTLAERRAAHGLLSPDQLYVRHARLFSALVGDGPAVHFADFDALPWPVLGFAARADDVTDAAVREFYGAGPMAKCSRRQLLHTHKLWHPDKFAQRYARRVAPALEEEGRAAMTTVARVVLDLAKEKK